MNLFLALLEAMGLVTPAVERHVSDVGDDADDGSAKTPYRTIAHALADPAGLPAGQRLVVKLHGTLTESVALPSHVSLQGPATLTASTAGPAIRIAGTGAGRTTDVALTDLVVQGTGAYTDDGGAVLITSADQVTLERCELRGSQAGRGGGLAILSSTAVTVRACKVHDNTAGTPATTLAGADIGPISGITLPTGHGNGGGIFVRDSDAEITGCDVFENQAILAGGGIAVSNDTRGASVVNVRDCQVTSNQVSHPPLAALGAKISIKRADVGDPIREAFNNSILAVGGVFSSSADPDKLVALLHGLNFESGLGGGISVRNASAVRIAQCHIGVTRAGVEGANRARRGAGISCYIGAYPTIEDNEIANNVAGGDGGGIAADQFDPVLPPGTATAFGISAIPMVPRSPIAVNRNRIHDNQAIEDGGGVYGSGNVQLAVKGGSVTGNRSAQDGGGLRATYASNLYVEGVTIANNQSNVVGSESDAGGGVSARNAAVTLRDCELTGNVANLFAGGAVYFASMWEGGIETTLGIPSRVANKQSTFDQMMATAYTFHTRVLRLINCRGSRNTAQGDSGAGGFLYAVRSAEPASAGGILGGGEPMWIDIEGARTAIDANTSEYTKAGMRKRGNLVIELSGTVIGASLVPQDRVWIGPEIAAGAIAQSTPDAPVPAQARAVVVMLDRDSTHDVSRLTWDGTGYVFGPVPSITAVAPTMASTAGGTVLTISGARFDPGNMSVLVGDAPCTPATVAPNAGGNLVVTSPPGPAGAADVTVISPSGARVTLAAAVTLAAP
jgi:IPT/TIG domain/Right handed beta helix region